jgi:dipeptidyl aminopeptidase/acylaminoacyl peptidase
MIQFRIAPPPGATLATGDENFALAPDGGAVVYRAALATERRQLWLRALDGDTDRALPGTTGATRPVWSPDGRSIAFHQSGKLKRLELAGGPVEKICDTPANSSVTWGEGGVILFAKEGVIHRVSAARSEPVATRLRSVRPRFLPGGSRFLYSAADPKGRSMRVASLDGSVDKKLLDGDWTAVYGGGYVFHYHQSGEERALRARPFDLNRLEFTGDTLTVAESLTQIASVFANGTLVLPPGSGRFDLQLVDRNGKLISLLNPKDKRRWGHPRFSPDASKLVVDEGGDGNQWVIDIARGVQSRLTFGSDRGAIGVFSPDGSRIYYRTEVGAPAAASTSCRPTVPERRSLFGAAVRTIWTFRRTGSGSSPEEGPLALED